MDGFLPLVYKSFKKNKVRRRYECLSSGTVDSYNIADFYHSEDAYRPHQHDVILQREPLKSSPLGGAHHRRYSSVHVAHVKSSGSASKFEDLDRGCDKPKQLVRFRSHRMFSCINGA
ncbi:uncharacterized protein LOC142541317 [Primulina tabacum]|uniref:uncharacterized protein LOC142541317 n=1 Tax=Primulina tabacum TaxID=48773 RepID=UPI003F5A4791